MEPRSYDMRLSAVLLVCAALACAWWAVADDAAGAPVPKQIQWAKSYEAALAAAEESGKPVFMDFYSDRCGYCHKMDREVFVTSLIRGLSTKFECVKVNTGKRRDLVDKYNIGPVPTYIFSDAEGNLLYTTIGYMPTKPFSTRMTRALEVYANKDEMAALLEKRDAGEITGEELARLAYLLRRADKDAKAGTVAEEALQALPADSPARAGAELDEILVALSDNSLGAIQKAQEWTASHSDSPRRWEAIYETAIAQANAGALAQAARGLERVVAGDGDSEFGLMASHYKGIIDDILACPTGG